MTVTEKSRFFHRKKSRKIYSQNEVFYGGLLWPQISIFRQNRRGTEFFVEPRNFWMVDFLGPKFGSRHDFFGFSHKNIFRNFKIAQKFFLDRISQICWVRQAFDFDAISKLVLGFFRRSKKGQLFFGDFWVWIFN